MRRLYPGSYINKYPSQVPQHRSFSGYHKNRSYDELVEFSLDFNIAKKPKVTRQVNNFKKADLYNLKATLAYTPWDIVFDESSIDNSLQNWMHLFLTIVDQYIPKVNIKNNFCPWFDKDVIHTLHTKDRLCQTTTMTGLQQHIDHFNASRRENITADTALKVSGYLVV